MKTIVVPTDYTGTSSQVIDYAAQLALQTKAQLILYHAFFEPYAVTEAPVQVPTRKELIAENKTKLEKIGEKLKWQYQIEVDYATSPFPLLESLAKVVAEKKADLVVMGIRAAHNWERVLFGSSTAEAIRKADFPLLTIPQEVHFNQFKNILFACDFASLRETTDLTLLQEFAASFQAQVQILHLEGVTSHREVVGITSHREEYAKRGGRIKLDTLLRGVDYSYVEMQSADIVEGIGKATRQFKADLLVMASHKHNFWDILLNKSNTRRIVFQTHIPLLSLPLREV